MGVDVERVKPNRTGSGNFPHVFVYIYDVRLCLHDFIIRSATMIVPGDSEDCTTGRSQRSTNMNTDCYSKGMQYAAVLSSSSTYFQTHTAYHGQSTGGHGRPERRTVSGSTSAPFNKDFQPHKISKSLLRNLVSHKISFSMLIRLETKRQRHLRAWARSFNEGILV